MNEISWEQWKNYLLYEYQRMSMMKNNSMGGQFTKGQKGFTVIFLITKQLDLSSVDVFPEIIKIIKGDGRASIDKNNDVSQLNTNKNGDISMLGHKFGMFGMIESIDNLYKYLTEAHQLLNSKGQILLTSINTQNLSQSQKQNNYSENKEMKFQSGNLYGPYFGLFFIDLVFLQNQAEKTDWRFKLIHKQEEESYSVLFMPSCI